MNWIWWVISAFVAIMILRIISSLKKTSPTLVDDDTTEHVRFISSRPATIERLPQIRTTAPAGAPMYRLEYADAYGEVTARTISVLAVAQEPSTGALYLQTFCHLRNDDRTFRVDRILRVTRVIDNMVVANPSAHFNALATALPGGMQWWGGKSPDDIREKEEHDRVMARARAGLYALVWLALADGEISEEEIVVMFDWIAYRAAASRDGRTKWDRDLARQTIRTARPTLDDIRGGLGRMGKAESAQFQSALAVLAAADGATSRLEEGRIAQIKKALSFT